MAKKSKYKVGDPEHVKLLRKLSEHFGMDEAALKRKRKSSWPKGKTPPHLKKYLFK